MGESSPDSPLEEKKRSRVRISLMMAVYMEVARTTAIVMRWAIETEMEILLETATL